jgi:hypothetical protein
VVVWRDFEPLHIPKDIWPQYIKHVMFEWFTRCSQSSAGNQNLQIRSFCCTYETDGKINLNEIYR